MAHANIFQRVTKPSSQQAQETSNFDDSTIETIKVLGEQVISLREIIEEQHLVIEDLAQTVTDLRTDQQETSQNLNLAYIDQKDLAKQLRILRSNLDANQYVQQKRANTPKTQNQAQATQSDREIEELFFNNAKNSTVMKNSQASDAIKQTLAELKKLEKPKKKFLEKKAMEEQQVHRSPAVKTKIVNRAKPQAQARTQQSSTLQRSAASVKTKKLSNEELAKKMIFGKTSKLINRK